MDKLTAQEAESRGYTIDRTCFPWIGYTGARFALNGVRVIVLIPPSHEYVE